MQYPASVYASVLDHLSIGRLKQEKFSTKQAGAKAAFTAKFSWGEMRKK